MTQLEEDAHRAGRARGMFWGVLAAMAFCATVMGVMMIAGPKMMGRMCGRMRTLMQTCGNEDPMEILKRRYASGEASEEEFQRIKQELAE